MSAMKPVTTMALVLVALALWTAPAPARVDQGQAGGPPPPPGPPAAGQGQGRGAGGGGGLFPDYEADDATGFVPIFDGKTLAGWDGDTTFWRAENGEIVG